MNFVVYLLDNKCIDIFKVSLSYSSRLNKMLLKLVDSLFWS